MGAYTFARKTFPSCANPVPVENISWMCIPAIDWDWYMTSHDNYCTFPANYRVTWNIYMQWYIANLNWDFSINLWIYKIFPQWWKINSYSGKMWANDWWKWWFCLRVNYYTTSWSTPCPYWTYVLDPGYPRDRFLPSWQTLQVPSDWILYCARAIPQYIDPNYN